MGDVLLAVAVGAGGINKLHVVKRLRDDLAGNAEFLAMFFNEARIAARIDHPNVVQTYEVGFDGECHFSTMEYLEGQSLEALFQRGAGTVAPEIYLAIVCDALAGLHHAHELCDYDGAPLRIVHRDISPQNIFVTYEGPAKILDFGIAKAADSVSATRTGAVKGKMAYMPLEQLERGPTFDRRADVFAVGAIMWRIITGERLWQGMSDPEIYLHLTEERSVPSPRTRRPDAPPGLVAICERALAFDPDDRYPTALALREAIEAYLESQGLRAMPRQVGSVVAELFAAERAQVSATIAARFAQGTPVEEPRVASTAVPSFGMPLGLDSEGKMMSAAPIASAFDAAARRMASERPQPLATPERPSPPAAPSDPSPGRASFAAAASPGRESFAASPGRGSSTPGLGAFDSAAVPPAGQATSLPSLSDDGATRALAALPNEDDAGALGGAPQGGALVWLRLWGMPLAAALLLAVLVLAARGSGLFWDKNSVPEEYAPSELRAPPAGSLVLRIVAAPPNARVLVDQRPLQRGVVSYAQGEARHHLSITAPDHEPYADWVTLREPRTTLRVTLQPTPTKGSAPAPEVVREESPGG
jgi:serine/threonine-protein kinase